MYQTHNQMHYAGHLIGHSENRSFVLYAEEELQLLIPQPQRFLYIMEGKATIVRQDGTQLEMAAESEDNRPVSLRSCERITIKAAEDSHLFEVGAEALDELHAWDALSDHIDDEILLRRMEMVRGSTSFRRLPAESVQSALECMTMVDVKAGETVMQQGDEGNAFYLIVTGEAEVWATGLYDDEPQLISSLKTGDGFGEEALISGGRVAATVKMTTNGHLLRMRRADYKAIVSDTMVNEVNAELARAMLDNGYDLLDVRYEEEHEEEHLPGCKLIPLHELRDRVNELDPHKRYVVYCRSGRRSSVAAVILGQHNLQVVSLKGGIRDWPFDKESALA